MTKSVKPKVLFIHPDLGIGGAERLVLDVAVALSKKEKDVLFLTNHFDKKHAFEELQDNIFQVHVLGDWIPRSICGFCQALWAYIRMIFLSLVYVLFIRNVQKPDVYFIDQIPMAVPFIKLFGGKVIYYCHHPDLLGSSPGGILKKLYRLPINWLEMKGTSMADIILMNSRYTASIFKQTFPQITKDIEIVYPTISSSYQNMISTAEPVKSITEIVPEINLPNDCIIFLSINRYHPAKNLELALNGLEMLKTKLSSEDWNRTHLIMAGGYDPRSSINAKYFSSLVSMAETKDLITKITFLKSPSDSLKADLLLACTCLIYTPINEHFGIVPLEAMCAKKPVIACNSGGPCETIDPDVTGYLCEPTPESLAEAMLKIFNKDTANTMGIQGKERLDKLFSYKAFLDSVNKVVARTISKDSFKKEDENKVRDDNKQSSVRDIGSEQKFREFRTEKQQTDLSRRSSNSSQLDSVLEEPEVDDSNSAHSADEASSQPV